MVLQKVLQNLAQFRGMSQIAAFSRDLDILDDHPFHAEFTVRRSAEIIAKLEGQYVRQMLMFGNRRDFVFGEPVEADAVLNRQYIVGGAEAMREKEKWKSFF